MYTYGVCKVIFNQFSPNLINTAIVSQGLSPFGLSVTIPDLRGSIPKVVPL